jgi:hypothetical protein
LISKGNGLLAPTSIHPAARNPVFITMVYPRTPGVILSRSRIYLIVLFSLTNFPPEYDYEVPSLISRRIFNGNVPSYVEVHPNMDRLELVSQSMYLCTHSGK